MPTPPPLPGVPPPLPGQSRREEPRLRKGILSLDEIERFKNLLVFAKTTVEGYFTGKHRSPYRGSSSEFADYKEYVAGDNLSDIDWRVYGRTKRLFVRQYEHETDMCVYLLLDASASMNFRGRENKSTKYVHASRIAAALSYLMIHQGDKASLALFNKRIRDFVPPGGTRRHLYRMVTALEGNIAIDGTRIAHALHECASLFRRKGRLVVLSDFHDDTDELFEALSLYLHRGFEILLMQVLDPEEIHLPDALAARFMDMETMEEIQVDPDEIRQQYKARMKEFVDTLAGKAARRGIDYHLINTGDTYLQAIEAYLGFRGKKEINFD